MANCATATNQLWAARGSFGHAAQDDSRLRRLESISEFVGDLDETAPYRPR